MRILIIAAFFPPQRRVAAARPHAWALTWAREGHAVDVLTLPTEEALPEQPFQRHAVAPRGLFGSLRGLYRGRLKEDASSPGRGRRSPLRRIYGHLAARGLGSSTRMPDPHDLWIGPATAWAHQQSPGWDLVVSTAGPYATHVIAARLRKSGCARHWVADYRDLWTENPFYRGIPPFTWIERCLEHRLLRRADLISTVSDPLADALRRRAPQTDLLVVPNGFLRDDLAALPSVNLFSDRSRVHLVYTGALYDERSEVLPLLHALADLAARDPALAAKLAIQFAGPPSAYLAEQIRELALDALVEQRGLLPHRVALQMQRDADVLLFFGYRVADHAGIVTGKLFEYLSSGTKIWAIGVSEEDVAGRLITQSRTGLLLPARPNAVAQQLERLLEDRAAETAIAPDETFIASFERTALATDFLAMIRSALSM